ncbi:MAG: hypothetical protein ABFC63_00985 [Thermoguttaceae bacterium]
MGTTNELDELFDKAVQLEKRGAWDDAISLYEQAIDKWGDRPEAVYAKNSVTRLREMEKTSSWRNSDGDRPARNMRPRRGIQRSVCGALALIAWDAGLGGTFLMSALVCPIWFLISIQKNLIERPGWRVALLRIAIPALTLGLVLANNAVQYRIAKMNAPRIISACEQFHAANGTFPKTLNELIPQYLPSIPRAKYCLMWGDFLYWNCDENPILVWYVVPPFGRKIYGFKDRRWGYLD